MTRLTAEHIGHIEASCEEWDRYLKAEAGLGLFDIAARVSGRDAGALKKAAETYKVYVVPVTAGQGRIDSFSESVAAIIKAAGFDARVSGASDVAGLCEAHAAGADIVFMADDNRYIALNLKNGNLGENNIATARGYIELLDSCAALNFSKGLDSKEVLLIGYGAVGTEMAAALKSKNAAVTVYDKDEGRLRAAAEAGYKITENRACFKSFGFIADATSEGGWLTIDLLPEAFILVTPGVPLSLDTAARDRYKGRYFFDTLEIGTAAMLGLAV